MADTTASRVAAVSVPSWLVRPRRRVTRNRWVSTGSVSVVCAAKTSTQAAVLCPTPGRLVRYSMACPAGAWVMVLANMSGPSAAIRRAAAASRPALYGPADRMTSARSRSPRLAS